MKKTDIHRFVDQVRVREAIDAVQRLTSAPIHVSISPFFWGNVRRTAERAFRKHNLAKTSERKGVLFFVVPSRREFTIVGDVGAHKALGQSTWEAAAATLQQHFSNGKTAHGLVSGIEEIAGALRAHFPLNELPGTTHDVGVESTTSKTQLRDGEHGMLHAL